MSWGVGLAARAATAVFYCSVLVVAVWLLWYGQYQWAGYDCKVFRQGIPGGHPASWGVSTACALTWQRPLLQANLGFMFLAPAVAALAAIAVMGLRQHKAAGSTRTQAATATLQSWGSTLLWPKRFWLWWCDGLTVKDALVIAVWAAYNAVWYSTVLGKALSRLPPGMQPSPRLIAKSFASLMMPNLVPLLMPVSRGSVISNAIGLSYPDGIRYHRWLGQWVLMLVSLHGLIYWISWAADGRWLAAALRGGADTNNLLGGVALLCALLLWATSQAPVRRWWYTLYKTMHHVGFWGFMILGVAHHWSLFWYFVPGMIMYAVDGVFRLHQMFAGRSGQLDTRVTAPGAAAEGCFGVNTEVLKADADPAAKMCSLLLSAPEFGVAPAGIVWLNVPALSVTAWHAFDYTASQVIASADGRVCNAYNAGNGTVEGHKKTALSVHIKAYNRWSKALVSQLAQGNTELSIRMQGPYADPPSNIGQPDGVILVAGGNGIASALPVFEELSGSGVSTQGLPALLLWACRKGYEFEVMAAPVLAAARTLGLNLTIQLHITDGADISHIKGSFKAYPAASADTSPLNDHNSNPSKAHVPTVAIASSTTTTSSSSSSSETGSDIAVPVPVACTHGPIKDAAVAGVAGGAPAAELATMDKGVAAAPSGLCPVVAFASFAAQLSFKAILHVMVFGGFLLGLFVATYVGGALQVAAGKHPWETAHLGPALVLIPAAFAVGLGLITLWIGLFVQRRMRDPNPGLALSSGPAAAIAAASGKLSQLTVAAPSCLYKAAKDDSVPAELPSAFELHVPTLSGNFEILPVVAERPAVSTVMQSWLTGLQQLPTTATAQDGKISERLSCVVYGCGPTTLDHATQLAVASVAAKQRRSGGACSRPVQLQFVRKAQML